MPYAELNGRRVVTLFQESPEVLRVRRQQCLTVNEREREMGGRGETCSKQAGSQQQRQQQRWRWQTTTTGNLIFRSPPDARINKRRAVQAGSSPYSSDSSDLFLPGTASRRKGSSTVDKGGRDSQDPGLITREMEQTAIEM
ncbi:hypothetical protein C0Q70_09811 [Pomacea canaliculata]|uniref:Uncharacterized protein n=1 Tax=Pomacea canaliculata TaxID=400727 RepID=A0A2T7PAU6_POMCA|nr:hypothetical protein C0Q70_09811 [Pomacea canaliculata]